MFFKHHFLAARVKVKEHGKTKLWLPPLFISIYLARSAIISADGLLGLFPGQPGRIVRAASDALQEMLFVLMDEGLSVDVKVKDEEDAVSVWVRMV
jgi:hypothetical protein